MAHEDTSAGGRDASDGATQTGNPALGTTDGAAGAWPSPPPGAALTRRNEVAFELVASSAMSMRDALLCLARLPAFHQATPLGVLIDQCAVIGMLADAAGQACGRAAFHRHPLGWLLPALGEGEDQLARLAAPFAAQAFAIGDPASVFPRLAKAAQGLNDQMAAHLEELAPGEGDVLWAVLALAERIGFIADVAARDNGLPMLHADERVWLYGPVSIERMAVASPAQNEQEAIDEQEQA